MFSGQLTSKLVATVAYVASRGVHLDSQTKSAQYALPAKKIDGVWYWPTTKTVLAVPNANDVVQIFWQGFAKYSSLQTQLQLRAFHGLSGQAGFTLGRCISNNDSGAATFPFQNSLTIIFPWDNDMATGPCDFDIHDNFTG